MAISGRIPKRTIKSVTLLSTPFRTWLRDSGSASARLQVIKDTMLSSTHLISWSGGSWKSKVSTTLSYDLSDDHKISKEIIWNRSWVDTWNWKLCFHRWWLSCQEIIEKMRGYFKVSWRYTTQSPVQLRDQYIFYWSDRWSVAHDGIVRTVAGQRARAIFFPIPCRRLENSDCCLLS